MGDIDSDPRTEQLASEAAFQTPATGPAREFSDALIDDEVRNGGGDG
jgi:hypothetical protein